MEALTIADAYDLPAIGLLLKHVYLLHQPDDFFAIFALASATKDEELARG